MWKGAAMKIRGSKIKVPVVVIYFESTEIYTEEAKPPSFELQSIGKTLQKTYGGGWQQCSSVEAGAARCLDQ